MTESAYAGVLLAESLREGAALDAVPLTVTGVRREAAGDVTAGQPSVWTFITFTVPASSAEDLSSSLSQALEREGGWYCDFHSDAEVIVVFHGRVFRYPKGDVAGRSHVESYARSVGVPEAQLDWPE